MDKTVQNTPNPNLQFYQQIYKLPNNDDDSEQSNITISSQGYVTPDNKKKSE